MKISQKALQGELVRITTSDGLELHGLLYETEKKTNRIVIHIHGWTGNFYENEFLDYIAKACLENNVSFLSFNTRGAGFVQEFLKKSHGIVKYIKIGGSLEKFVDCVIDIGAVTKFLRKRKYKHIFIEGHSTGAQKATYYALVAKDPLIKGLILLEPADDPSTVKRFLAERYEEAMDYAKKVVSEKKQDQSMPEWIHFGVQLSAQKFLSLADPTSAEGELFYLPGKLEKLKQLEVPVLLISADMSEYQDAKISQKKVKEAIKNVEQHIISNSNHWFFGQEEEVGNVIGGWLKEVG